jgi:hypothetical protein
MDERLKTILCAMLELIAETRDKAAPMSDTDFYVEVEKIRGMITGEPPVARRLKSYPPARGTVLPGGLIADGKGGALTQAEHDAFEKKHREWLAQQGVMPKEKKP